MCEVIRRFDVKSINKFDLNMDCSSHGDVAICILFSMRLVVPLKHSQLNISFAVILLAASRNASEINQWRNDAGLQPHSIGDTDQAQSDEESSRYP